ncbi:MAG: sugar phosphate nucleotidyltransferase [Anaerolineae bacterium]
MRGVVLAGGQGTRLQPLTRVTNKHLLPIFDRPMVYYPIEFLVRSGVRDIMVVAGGNHAGEFLRLLGNGQEFGLRHLQYAYQDKPGGIADALSLAEDFVDGEKFVVCLGDNVFEYAVPGAVERFAAQPDGARVLVAEVPNPCAYGVPVIEEGRLIAVEEKPAKPRCDLAVVGLYMLDGRAFDVIRALKPSGRGELEITDVTNWYLANSTVEWEKVEGFWGDCGESIEGWLHVNNLVHEHGANKVKDA